MLNDYGRAMAADFMSTWSVEDEAIEFIKGESSSFDIGLDYRHLALQSKESGFTHFPMLLDFDCAYHLGNLTLAGSVGYYSRNRIFESRENYGQLRLFQRTTIRAGYFMPTLGINTNDHSLSIKRIAGLSRGSESYNIELWDAGKYYEIFYTVSAPSFYLESADKNFYRLATQEGTQAHRLRISILPIKRHNVGLNFFTSEFAKMRGVFYQGSLFKKQYLFYEYNFTENQGALYARFGYFLFRGFDLFWEADQSKNRFSSTRNSYVGFDWMVRPRFEISLKISLGDSPSQYQAHLWW